jgi:hypothetical protein
MPTGSNDEITLPMTRDNAVFDFSWSFMDTHQIRDRAVSGTVSLLPWPFPPGTLLFQGSNEFFLEFATSQAVDVGVDGFMRGTHVHVVRIRYLEAGGYLLR